MNEDNNTTLNKLSQMNFLILLLLLSFSQLDSTMVHCLEINKLQYTFLSSQPQIEISEMPPYKIPKMHGIALKLLNKKEEELVPIISIASQSMYIQYDENKTIVAKYDAKNLIHNEGFWCSAGYHSVQDEVSLNIEFDQSYRLEALWLYWAYAPGEFRIKYSNDKINWNDLFQPKPYRLSVENGKVEWWQKILSDPKTRWSSRSFDERIEFDRPSFARYIILSMRIPFNQFFGIYKIHFYRKIQSIVMLKSKLIGSNLCLSISNGNYLTYSPLYARECEDSIAYGDNRDLFILNSNGYITAHDSSSKCIQSARGNKIHFAECSIAEEYKDDRAKWIIEYTGKIISVKEPTKCLSFQVSKDNYVHQHLIKVTASSTAKDGAHEPELAIAYGDGSESSFWTSEATNNIVVFELMFENSLVLGLQKIVINWKFPAKKFFIKGLLHDGNWKRCLKVTDNRDTETTASLFNTDFRGIKIIMLKSTTIIEETRHIYAISKVYLFYSGFPIQLRDCNQEISKENQWELIDITATDDTSGIAEIKEKTKLYKSLATLDSILHLYELVPQDLKNLRETNMEIDSKIKEQIKGELTRLKTILALFEHTIHDEPENANGLGSNKFYPALDCSSIKKAFPSKRSGYYWIKNFCMQNPFRVFCDFSQSESMDYYLVKEKSAMPKSSFKNALIYIRKSCASYGMEPLDFSSDTVLKRFMKLAKKTFPKRMFRTDKGEKFILPFGVIYHKDPECAFRSLNQNEGSKMDAFLKNFKQKEDKIIEELEESFIDNSVFSINNVIAIGGDHKLIETTFEQSSIVGYACSTNNNKINEALQNHKDIGCDTTFHSDIFKEIEIGNTISVVCPENCSLAASEKVYGTDVYTDNSPICKAAIHNGVIQDSTGGHVNVILIFGADEYKGSAQHYIDSSDYHGKWPRSFRFEKFQVKCPLQYLDLDYLNQLSDKYMCSKSKTKNRIIGGDIDIETETKTTIQIKTSFLSVEDNISSQELGKLIHNLSAQNDFQKLASRSLSSQLQITTLPAKDLITQEAIIVIDGINKITRNFISEAQQSSNILKIISSKAENEISKIQEDPNVGLHYFSTILDSFEDEIKTLKKLIFRINRHNIAIAAQVDHKFKFVKESLGNFQRNENFMEDFSNKSILTFYNIFNSIAGKPKDHPARWEYYQLNLKGHLKVIAQRGSFEDRRTGSHLIIRDRDFYDFEIRFSLFISNGNQKSFGVAFRYMDSFNYYIFEISLETGKGFKRVRKFVKGEASEIDINRDGGYNVDRWMYFKIRGELNKFQIYMYESTDDVNIDYKSLDSKYSLVQQFTDPTFVHGTVAFTSQGLNSIYLDSISVVHIHCTEIQEKTLSEMIPITNSCNRYRENFKHIYARWLGQDPLNMVDGPSIWGNEYQYDGRTRVIKQGSMAWGNNGQEEGLIYILKDRYCSNGEISAAIKPVENENILRGQSSASVGVVFKFQDYDNYYVLEIFHHMTRIRKKINGKFELVKTDALHGYIPNQWMRVKVKLMNEKFNVFWYQNMKTQEEIKIFPQDTVDFSLKTGNIGLWTFKTAAFFDSIEMRPNDDEFPGSDFMDTSNTSPHQSYLEKTLNSINKNIQNYSWKTCLIFKDKEMRKRECRIIFNSSNDIGKCEADFCGSCCTKYVEVGVKVHKYLCFKQCKKMETPSNHPNALQKCIEPDTPSRSIYSHCDKLFQFDPRQKGNCKTDMCKLCCVTDGNDLADGIVQKCLEDCIIKQNGQRERTSSLLVTDDVSLDKYREILNKKKFLNVECDNCVITIPYRSGCKFCHMASMDQDEMFAFSFEKMTTIDEGRLHYVPPNNKPVEDVNTNYPAVKKEDPNLMHFIPRESKGLIYDTNLFVSSFDSIENPKEVQDSLLGSSSENKIPHAITSSAKVACCGVILYLLVILSSVLLFIHIIIQIVITKIYSNIYPIIALLLFIGLSLLGPVGIFAVKYQNKKKFFQANILLIISGVLTLTNLILPIFSEAIGITLYNYLNQQPILLYMGYSILLLLEATCLIFNFYYAPTLKK